MTASLRCLIALCVLLAAPSVPGSAQSPATYTNPVLPGDHPDPSVIRVGREYWATATTSQWAPVFPLLRSVDLVNWTLAGAVFQTPPTWSEGSYWAPEISADRGRYFVYYTGRRKNGPLCIAVATAMQPSGPYVDHGPLACQEVGSIDAAPVTAEGGVRYLVWKEDGNSRHLPTPIWAQRLSPDGTRLVGERHQLLRNEAQWEGPLIEGPFILQRNGWLYMFYSAGACCGRSCDYRLGVARARRLLGPWERNPANPILSGNNAWKCPGHGTAVTTASGRTYLLYHAYRPGDFEYSGRQGLLDEVTWGEDGWPTVNGGHGPSASAAAPLGVAEKDPATIGDEFEQPRLSPAWQWPWNHAPVQALRDGFLTLTVAEADPANAAGTVIARPTVAGNYVATTRLLISTLQNGGSAGLAAYGNGENALGISTATGRVTVWRREKAVQSTIAAMNLPPTAAVLLRLEAADGRRFRFAVSADEGRTWHPVGEEAEGGYLPPWDLGVRVALVAGGPAGTRARFDWLHVDTAR